MHELHKFKFSQQATEKTYMVRCWIMLVAIVLFISGCSPFGNTSLVQRVSDDIAAVFQTKVSAEMNSGGTQNLVSVPTSAAAGDVHMMAASVGNVYQQSTFVTSQGNTVEILISGTSQ